MIWRKKRVEQRAGDAAMRVSLLLSEDALSDSWRFYHAHEDSIRVDIADFVLNETVFSMHLSIDRRLQWLKIAVSSVVCWPPL